MNGKIKNTIQFGHFTRLACVGLNNSIHDDLVRCDMKINK